MEEERTSHSLRSSTTMKRKVRAKILIFIVMLRKRISPHQTAASWVLTTEVSLHHLTLERRVLHIKAFHCTHNFYWLPLILIALATKRHFPRHTFFFFFFYLLWPCWWSWRRHPIVSLLSHYHHHHHCMPHKQSENGLRYFCPRTSNLMYAGLTPGLCVSAQSKSQGA